MRLVQCVLVGTVCIAVFDGNLSFISVLAKERKSGAPPLLGIQFSFDVVERM